MTDDKSLSKEDKRYLTSCWKLILGKSSESHLGKIEGEFLNKSLKEMSDLLDYLYSSEYDDDFLFSDLGIYDKKISKKADYSESSLSILKWLKKTRMIFPNKTVEIMEKDAIKRYNLKEILTDKDILNSIEPNEEILEMILMMKEQMDTETLLIAKRIVKEVVYKILEQKLLDKNKYEKNKKQVENMADATLNTQILDDIIKDLMAKYNIVTYVK